MGRIMCDFGFLRPGRVFTQLLAVFACSVFVLVILCLLFCFFYGNSKLRRGVGFGRRFRLADPGGRGLPGRVVVAAGLPVDFLGAFWAGRAWLFATLFLPRPVNSPSTFLAPYQLSEFFLPGRLFLRGSASARLNLSTRARKWREIVGALNFWQRRRRKSGGQLRFLC